MKTNVKISCAVSAMLFGGTLGAAHAGVTGIQTIFGGISRTLLSASDYYTFVNASGFQMNGPVLFSDPALGAASCSQFTASGFSLTANLMQGVEYTFNVNQYFTVAGDVNFVLSGAELGVDDYVMIQRHNADGSTTGHAEIYPIDPGPFNLSGTLADTSDGGYYHLEYFLYRTPDASASIELFNLSFTSVPAPGAAALLGLAGLAGNRRRRR